MALSRRFTKFTRRQLLAAAAGVLSACRREPDAAVSPAVDPAKEWLLSPGSAAPDWSLLDPFQESITRADFERGMLEVLSNGALWQQVEVLDTEARIRMSTPQLNGPRYTLRFAAPGRPAARGTRYWRTLGELPPLSDSTKPLSDLHIVLDPGHIGGAWAQMEERWFQPPNAPAVKEGELSLRAARALAPTLEALGARVSHTRTRPEPATGIRPGQLLAEARESLLQDRKPADEEEIRREAERLFYRAHEIRGRGTLVNETLRPDLVICLHFNADDSWGRPENPILSPRNHLHILAHGCIGPDEAMLDDQRLEGLLRLVQHTPDTELPLCSAVAKRMRESTGLPPYHYFGGNARLVPGETYVWTRNLLANRIYRCPVIFCEPYVMNNEETIARFTAGDYEGLADVAGVVRPSIFREYASGVAKGLRDYFSARI